MHRIIELCRRIPFLAAALVGCSEDGDATSDGSSDSDAGTSGGATSSTVSSEESGAVTTDTSGPDVPPMPVDGFFDACGGKIVDPQTGMIDREEYERQARAWDVATIDCRLGPKFADVFPMQDDARPTLYEPPRQPVPVPSSAHLDTYQVGAYSQNEESYGVAVAQTLYVPDDDDAPGVDRIYALDWRNNMISLGPDPQPDGGGHPEQAVTDPAWAEALGHPVRHPIAVARPSLGVAANAIILFQDGLLGAAPWRPVFYKLPDAMVPTAVAVTNNNEFVLVTVWDTTNPDEPRGRLAVLVAHWGLPTAEIGTTHWGGETDAELTLLGYVDLPFATPTFVTAAGNNGIGASIDIYFAPTIEDLADPATRAMQGEEDPYTWSTIASSGYAIVLSRWENEAAFIDLQPLYAYVRTWLVGTQENYDAATGGSTLYPLPGSWPRTFDDAPEQRPVVAYTVDIEHPLAALAGRGPKPIDQGASEPIQAHVSTLDGTVRSFDIRELVNRHEQTPAAAVELATFEAGYNPISMAWSGDVDPLDPTSTTFGNPRPNYSDSFIVLSRAERELLWVHTDGTEAEVFRSLRDSRLPDPVHVDRNNSFHDAYILSVADFSSHKVVAFRVGPLSGQLVRPIEELAPPDGDASIECGGELELGGPVFAVSGANVP